MSPNRVSFQKSVSRCQNVWEPLASYAIAFRHANIVPFSVRAGPKFLTPEAAYQMMPPFTDDGPASASPTLQCSSPGLFSLPHVLVQGLKEGEAAEVSRWAEMDPPPNNVLPKATASVGVMDRPAVPRVVIVTRRCLWEVC